MKLRKSLLFVALFVMTATVALGQGAQFKFLWSNVNIGGNEAWYPLLYDCNNPESDTLRDGTLVRIFKSSELNPPNPEADLPFVIGHAGVGGEMWPTNQFAFNSETLAGSGATSGSFSSGFFNFEGGTPGALSCIMYLQIGCWNEDSTEWNCCYYSHRMLPVSGYHEYRIGDPSENPFGEAVWTCIDSCPEPVDAIDDRSGAIPYQFEYEIFPNPFNPTTTINFATQKTDQVSLKVYDLAGRQVNSLVDNILGSGTHEIAFDATGLPSGIYLAHLQTTQYNQTKKLVLLK